MSDVMNEIRDEVAKNKILIYMKGARNFPECGFSAATVAVFEKLGRPFETINVLADPARRDGIKVYSKWPTIPQVYIDGQFVGGNDIVQELYASGELQQLVDRAFS